MSQLYRTSIGLRFSPSFMLRLLMTFLVGISSAASGAEIDTGFLELWEKSLTVQSGLSAGTFFCSSSFTLARASGSPILTPLEFSSSITRLLGYKFQENYFPDGWHSSLSCIGVELGSLGPRCCLQTKFSRLFLRDFSSQAEAGDPHASLFSP